MNKVEEPNKDALATLPIYGGVVFYGPYGKVASVLKDIRSSLPDGVDFIFQEVSPGRIWLKVEGRH